MQNRVLHQTRIEGRAVAPYKSIGTRLPSESKKGVTVEVPQLLRRIGAGQSACRCAIWSSIEEKGSGCGVTHGEGLRDDALRSQKQSVAAEDDALSVSVDRRASPVVVQLGEGRHTPHPDLMPPGRACPSRTAPFS